MGNTEECSMKLLKKYKYISLKDIGVDSVFCAKRYLGCSFNRDNFHVIDLRLISYLRGGSKKRKKKTYSKPKKKKHRHKNVKLKTLTFYKVEVSGKVIRLRRHCLQCGPGMFMAAHTNRVYCGHCGLTLESKTASNTNMEA